MLGQAGAFRLIPFKIRNFNELGLPPIVAELTTRPRGLLLVTGPVSANMAVALERTWQAVPDPKLVVALGDCACDGGIFGEGYASRGRVANVIRVDLTISGCPPPPLEILRGILAAVRRAP